MIRLTLKKILEYYDTPQLFVATDTLNINYLCVLYKQDECFHYLGVQISEMRLQNYLDGLLDLRQAYIDPERENSLYEVLVANEKITAYNLLDSADISEDMLPEAGYYHDTADAINNNETDTLQLSIPASDRGFFADMVRRMGWSASTLSQAVSKIAVL